MAEVDFTPFLLGFVLGIVLSLLLDIRLVAIAVATLVTLFILREFLVGGQAALIAQATQLALFAQEGQASGYIPGILVGKMAGGIRRGLLGGRRR